MNQRIWSGLSVTLLMTTLSTATTGQAQQTRALEQASQVSSPGVEVQQETVTTTPTSAQPQVQMKEVVKMGEYQSGGATVAETTEAIAKIQVYESAGNPIAILYVRDIPVLTFIKGQGQANRQSSQVGANAARPTKTASRQQSSQEMALLSEEQEWSQRYNGAEDGLEMENNPVWRATAVAAKLNKLRRDNVDAKAITVRWNERDKAFSIEVNSLELVQINQSTFLADTTRNLAQDALQATNRFRRLLGNAPPVRQIIGMPTKKRRASAPQVAVRPVRPVRFQMKGIASWYGPGFHGRRSASGERYNQNALTAAHRSLPFGTQVVVTNLNNGRSVIVRINDRGPFIRGRVIDLSAAAARELGVMQTGVAPVQIQVLGQPQQVAYDN